MAGPWQQIGRYRALVNPRFDSPALRHSLADIAESLSSPNARILQAGRHRTIRFRLSADGGEIDAVAKVFGRQSPMKDCWDRIHGSKALRTYAAAMRLEDSGIGTTPPVACLEQWRGPILASSIFVSVFLDDMVCFKDMLVDLWASRARFGAFDEAIRVAAEGVRRLHDSGCSHGDLGNQNIFLVRTISGGPYGEALFLDLNRARFQLGELSYAKRGRDLARICLPDGFMALFMRHYWNGEPPAPFLRAWRMWYRRFRIHSATRKFRHPLRELDYTLHPWKAPAQAAYPPLRMQWVWDDASRRPAQSLLPSTQLSFLENGYRREIMRLDAAMARRFKLASSLPMPKCLDAPAKSPIAVRLAVNAESCDETRARLASMRLDKILLRVSEADDPADVSRKISIGRTLAAEGVGVALHVQQAPTFLGGDPVQFAKKALEELGSAPDWVCVGQGVNSLPWGVRNADDRRRLLEASAFFVKNGGRSACRVVASAIESPIMQTSCGNIQELLGRNVRYHALALVWNRSCPPLGNELKTLQALASGSFYARQKAVVIAESTLEELGDFHSLPDFVGEICANATPVGNQR